MRTPGLVGIVVVAHCVVVGSIVLIQGCGTPPRVVPPPAADAPMPGDFEPMPAPTPKPLPSRAPEAKSWPGDTTIYVVKKGDALSVIARRYGVSMGEIMAMNAIKNPDSIRLGQKLVLPGKIDLGAPVKPDRPATKPAAPASAASVSGDAYVVKAGDTLSELASAHGTTVDSIRQANALRGDKIMVGQKLKIPGGNVADAPAPKAQPEVNLEMAPMSTLPEPVAIQAPPPVSADSTNFRTHDVAEGEDLYSVSLMWDVSIDELKRVNGLTDTTLAPGQVLQIPMAE